jgi:large subunit ribosomal protein L6
MSRIGKSPITIPAGVDVKLDGNICTVKGKLGTLEQEIDSVISVEIDGSTINLSRPNDDKNVRAKHGLYRSLISNMIVGVNEGFSKKLELVGVGYRAANQGQQLDLSLGYSHNILFEIPSEVTVVAVMDKGKNPIISLTSFDKQLLGMVTAKIRSLRKVEPYKGKGVRFVGEQIRRKAGKTASKK